MEMQEEATNMEKYEKQEVDPTARELSRRRFLRNAGITVAAVPFFGTFGEILTQSGACLLYTSRCV